MSESQLETLRNCYAAFNRGDLDAFVSRLSPTVRWLAFDLRLSPCALRGPAAVRDYLAGLLETVAEFHLLPERFVPSGRRVVVIVSQRGRARGSTIVSEMRMAHLWSFESGALPTSFRLYPAPERALAVIGAPVSADTAGADPARLGVSSLH